MGAGNSKETKEENVGTRYSKPVAVEREDYSKPLPREKLNKNLQKIVDKDDSLWDDVYEGRASDTTDTSLRYAAYARRLRTIMLSAQRYVAYTSDVGESFRPVAHPWAVRAAYGVSWAYLVGDVSNEGYKAYLRQTRPPGGPPVAGAPALAPGSTAAPTAAPGALPLAEAARVPPLEDWRTVVVQRALFQSLASMALPAFTIHSVVRYSGQAMKGVKNARLRTWGPIGLGLATVPLLPYMFDRPVEEAVEWTFHAAFKAVGGPQAVGHAPSTGREERLTKASKGEGKVKEKEL